MSQNTSGLIQEKEKLSIIDKVKNVTIGPLSLPVYVIFAGIVFMAAYLEVVPVDVLGGMGILISLGWLLGKIGGSIPVLNKYGGSTILSMIVPAVLILYNVFPENALASVDMLMSEANFLDLYVFSLVTGSILGMNRNVLIQGFARMVVPMMTGFVLALLIPSTVGWALGLGFQYTLFYIVTPSLAGGIGGGVLPLALGYSTITNMGYGEMVAILAPASILANFFAIIGAAYVSRIGVKTPNLTGNGTLVKSDKGMELSKDDKKVSIPISFQLLGSGFFLLIAVYIGGTILEGFVGLPAAVIVIFSATLLKYFQILPSNLEQGALQLNNLVSSNFTYPLMVGLGIIYLTLEDVLLMISWQYLVVIISTVVTLGLTGFFMAKYINMYPVEASILSLNQAAMGGTGNVAILSTSNRQEMMPFAQVATRIGGAITISLMITLLRVIL